MLDSELIERAEALLPSLTLDWLTKLYFEKREETKADLESNDLLRKQFEKTGITETFERDAAILRTQSVAIAAILSILVETGHCQEVVQLLLPTAREVFGDN